MGIIHIQKLFFFVFLILVFNIKGETIVLFLKSKYPIDIIRVNPNKIEPLYRRNKFKNIKFSLDCEQGDKISLDIISYNNKNKAEDFSLFLKFKEGNLYFLNHKNISITYNENFNILFEFYVPYEIYCKSNNDIIINESNINTNINFNLINNFYSKNQEKELGIKIIDFYYYNYRNMSIYPIINFNKSKNYELNTIFNVNFKNSFLQNDTFIIKYKGVNFKTGKDSFKECSLRIIMNNKRNLQTTTSTNEEEYYYTFGEIFDNEEAQENIDDIVEFLNQDINVFNISESFFQDLCIHYERDHADYVLEDRIEFFYQNYSLCNTSCNLTHIYFENFSFSCICWPEVETENTKHKKDHSMELNEEFSIEGLSQEMSNIFFESNLEVITCFFVLLGENIIMSNFGVLITGLLFLIQIIASLFLYSHMNDIRLYVFRDLIKCKYNPPLKKGQTSNIQEIDDKPYLVNSRANPAKELKSKKMKSILTNKIIPDNTIKINQEYGIELDSVKGMIPINAKNNNVKNIVNEIEIDENINYKNTFKNKKKKSKLKKIMNNYKYNNTNLKDLSPSSTRILTSKNCLDVNLHSKKSYNENKENRSKFYNTNLNLSEKKTRKNEDENSDFNEYSQYIGNNNKGINKENQYNKKWYDKNSNAENNYSQNGNILTSRITDKNNKEEKKDLIYPYEKIDYADNDLDELDYDEALIYDKRTFCQIFCRQLKKRQLIANTFCVKDKLKPFSIKLILFIFNITCYLVINGFLFSEEYVMKILRRKSKSFYYFIVDSTTRIIYSSIIGVVINIIVDLLFKSDKQIRKVQNKYQDNKVLMHGEIVKIYKSTKLIYIVFTIFNVFIMIIFIFYLFCFCGVYRNCQADWFEGCFINLFLLQFVSVLICYILAVFRKGGLNCKVDFLFKISSWIIDNL